MRWKVLNWTVVALFRFFLLCWMFSLSFYRNVQFLYIICVRTSTVDCVRFALYSHFYAVHRLLLLIFPFLRQCSLFHFVRTTRATHFIICCYYYRHQARILIVFFSLVFVHQIGEQIVLFSVFIFRWDFALHVGSNANACLRLRGLCEWQHIAVQSVWNAVACLCAPKVHFYTQMQTIWVFVSQDK